MLTGPGSKPEPLTHVDIADIIEITPPQMSRVNYDLFESNDGLNYAIPGIKRYGPMTMRSFKNFGNDWKNGTPITLDVFGYVFKAYVEGFRTRATIDSLTEFEYDLRITGPVVKKEEKKVAAQKIRNKFYVAHPKVHTNFEQATDNESTVIARPQRWTRKTLKDAVAHAEAILEANPQQDEACVVQIIRRVRRKKQPLIVETVR